MKKTYHIAGLSCSDCAARIQATVGNLTDVESANVDVNTGNLTVWLSVPEFDDNAVEKIVADTGHQIVREGESQPSRQNGLLHFMLSSRDTVLTLVSGLLTVLGIVLAVAQAGFVWRILPLAAAILIGSYPVLRHAWQEVAQARSLGINTLMVIAIIGAVFIGEWVEAAVVVVLFSLGEALESYATEKARGELESLLTLAPETALQLGEDGSTTEVDVTELALGNAIRVRAGDRVSVDGVVLAGQSAVDQSPITGESIPVEKEAGDLVFAGTLNTSGTLDIEVTRLAGDTLLQRMISLVREAQANRAPVQRTVEQFARYYTPLVAFVALLIASLPPLLFGQPFLGEDGWLIRALQMLIIACPCALVISTPVSVVSALTQAASRGVLIKGGRTLEALGRVQVFAFDKTGTLTIGKPVTTDVLQVCRDASHTHNGLQYAAAVETQSSHPLAQALVNEAHAQRLPGWTAESVTQIAGQGITGQVNGRQVTVGSHAFVHTMVAPSEYHCEQAEQLAAQGKTVMMVCHDDPQQQTHICSVLGVADTVRPSAQPTLHALRSLGMRTLMLSGDDVRVAQAIGASVGITDIRAGLLPEEKLDVVRALQHEGAMVAMIGDGVNDAPALATADVGIAMGAAGTDQAMETADVVLMGDDLHQLSFLVRLSQRTRQIIRMNIIIALAVKALVFILAAAGLANLWMAIVADVGASMVVILNGMRLRSMRIA